MTKQWEDNFDALLEWLDPDRDRAGAKYEDIRESLINIFSWRGYRDAEDWADEAISRVTNKVTEVAKNYTGDPALYFYAVARRLLYEVRRSELRFTTVENDQTDRSVPETDPYEDERHECLDRCLEQLTAANRELILLYHQPEQRKMDHRRKLARRLGTSPDNLRVKAHRIRTVLHCCIEKCLKIRAGH